MLLAGPFLLPFRPEGRTMLAERACRKRGGRSFWCLTRRCFPFACCMLLGNAAEDVDDYGAKLPTCTLVLNATFDGTSFAAARCRWVNQGHTLL